MESTREQCAPQAIPIRRLHDWVSGHFRVRCRCPMCPKTVVRLDTPCCRNHCYNNFHIDRPRPKKITQGRPGKRSRITSSPFGQITCRRLSQGSRSQSLVKGPSAAAETRCNRADFHADSNQIVTVMSQSDPGQFKNLLYYAVRSK